eukprot:m51a1_g129 putative alpha-l-arabinofuranosidase (854) ;mRNA; f:433766-437101
MESPFLGRAAFVTHRSPPSADFLWEFVELGGERVALRPAAFSRLVLCSANGVDLTLEALPPSSPTCSFARTAGLSDPNRVSLSMGGSAPESSVGLVASPASPEAATWVVTGASVVGLSHASGDGKAVVSIRHCNYLAYVTPVDSVAADFNWIVEAGDGDNNAVMLRSYNYPLLHLGLVEGSRTRLGIVSCGSRVADCTFIRGGNDTGVATLFLKAAGKYAAMGTRASADGCKFGAPAVDLVLGDVPAKWELSAVIGAPRKASLTVVKEKRHSISPILYGIFFEEINFAGDGGLYAELIRNRDFEALGRGNLGDGRAVSATANAADYRPWTARSVSSTASVKTDTSTQPFTTNPVVLSIQLEASSIVHLENPGFWGINCRAGMTYRGSLYARSTASATLAASLQNNGVNVSSVAVMVASGDWTKYEFEIEGVSDHEGAVFALLFRKDVFDYVAGLKPSFVRFPGGNYLEGNAMETHWDWKKSLGDPAARPGHYNDAWGYWTTDGLGLHEYLLFCEALGAAPQLSVFTGYFLTRKYVPIEKSGQFAIDAQDALEYANSDTDTPYGKLRADAGHPAPFNMRRVEVGNEETLMDEYRLHYNNITRGIWDRFPGIEVVASGWWGPDLKGNPCLSGSRCDAWDEHYYRAPDTLATMSTLYDSYDRKLPPVFVGEYAGADYTKESPESIQQAVSEASFMIGFERNADVVVQSSFAPLFRHTQGTQWRYDMICYNASAIYAMPAYDVQRLFRVEQCSFTLESKFTSPTATGEIAAVACVQEDGDLVLKISNYGPSDLVVDVDLSSVGSPRSSRVISLEAPSPYAANDLDNPHFVHTTERTVSFGDRISVVMPPYSLAVAIF